MTKGDKIYCKTCGKISFDDSPKPIFVHKDTKPCSKSRQDSRFNPNWNYRCAHCYSFKTINATQFLEQQKAKENNKTRGRKKNTYFQDKQLEIKILESIKHIIYNK